MIANTVLHILDNILHCLLQHKLVINNDFHSALSTGFVGTTRKMSYHLAIPLHSLSYRKHCVDEIHFFSSKILGEIKEG